MTPVPRERHLLRAKDIVDARYREPLDVPALARAACLSPAHFSREFRRVFGETPHQYLLTRRLERAAAMLRNTDRSVTIHLDTEGVTMLKQLNYVQVWVHDQDEALARSTPTSWGWSCGRTSPFPRSATSAG